MSVLIDTSAMLAYLDLDEPRHEQAVVTLENLAERGELLAHGHLIVEAVSLIQRRLGLDALADYAMHLEPEFEIVWIDGELHRRALAALLASGRRGVSFVDRVSFEVMRDRGIDTAFAFDPDFEAEGFAVVP